MGAMAVTAAAAATAATPTAASAATAVTAEMATRPVPEPEPPVQVARAVHRVAKTVTPGPIPPDLENGRQMAIRLVGVAAREVVASRVVVLRVRVDR